ncbi:MAG: D-aminoacylase [SAR324 cluster bacterium]|nr:D-aminoacylase [SAR324 cluster bacterium]
MLFCTPSMDPAPRAEWTAAQPGPLSFGGNFPICRKKIFCFKITHVFSKKKNGTRTSSLKLDRVHSITKSNEEMMKHSYDTVLRNARIYDGTGAAPKEGDVAVQDGRIVQAGTVRDADSRQEIDLRGLALCPGFIDVHTHDDFAAVLYPAMSFKLLGGVTTCIVGNCGFGAAPYQESLDFAMATHPNQSFPRWEGYAGYFETLEKNPPSLNIGALIGHGTCRKAAMGMEQRAPSQNELSRMKQIVREGLNAGAVGFSTGLVYEPGCYAETDEIVELASLMQESGGLYTSHIRNEGAGLPEAVTEAIRIGERAGVPVQISHHKASGRRHWGSVALSLALIEEAQARGLDVHADQYPYTAGSTILSAIVAQGLLAQDGGGIGEMSHADITIASTAEHPAWEGKSLQTLAEELGISLQATVEHVLREEPRTTIILHAMNEDDVQTVMRHPSTMIGSDGIPSLDGKPHPRLYGTFARVLGHYSRNKGLFPMENAIHRMTGLPAKKFHLADRGFVGEHAFADLLVFDPASIIDIGTFEDPNHYPEGIVHVFVNGVQVVQDTRQTNARPGRVLRRNN